MQQTVLAAEFKLIKLITQGKHAKIYQCISIKTGTQFAVKIQQKTQTSVLRQASLLLNIQKSSNILADYGLPICYFTQKNDKFNFLVQDLFGNDLQMLLSKCKGIFRINTFLMLADQMLKRLQLLHQKQYIHRSISLKKWALGKGLNSKKLYLLGFSRNKHYLKDQTHIPYTENKPLLNDLVYASINNHMGIEPSRRDDLESLVYCWTKMLYGALPWQKQKQPDRILSKKIEQRGEVLFQKFPQQMKDILNYIRGLSFFETPDYQKIRNWLFQLFQLYHCQFTYQYDWEMINKNGQYLQPEK